ncbi:MAG: putative acyl-CoA synthetase [Frankiales bacterium]|nr:putative acyl-CoA synthetase [Frankiales bacterium]
MAFRVEHLLRDAAAARPLATALRAGDAEVTWAELDAASDRVASCLVGQGIGVGDRVGLYLDKGVEAVAALYGTMRAGAAYVPIDPDGPVVRAAAIATDCALAAIISDPRRVAALRAVAPAAAPGGIVCGDAIEGFVSWTQVQESQPREPARPVVETDLAYVLYTSGSTGRPKGVAITHRNALTFVSWARDVLGLQPDDVLSNHAPLHFDLSTLDLFGAASVGATTCLVPEAAASFPAQLARWIDDSGITVWYSVPTALSMLVRYGNLASVPFSALRLVLFAGEVFPNRYLSELMRLVPDPRYFNLFGPTESNVCTYYEVTEPPTLHSCLPIGTACANSRCEVVDEAGVVRHGIGVQGELVVTGPGVAQGYWGNPELTAERFPAPHTYRTGDVVEVMDDSHNPSFRFLGRRDQLVKTRGYRVELGEVEAALYAHPHVRECVAVPVPDEAVGNRILAFCAPAGTVSEGDLAEACRGRLPAYMVPERIVFVDALPTTPNGKYDRKRLAESAAGLTGVSR